MNISLYKKSPENMETTGTVLSVIVPVYNVEKYLRKCIDSILAQDITDMEVILVDGGSSDGSGKICDEYAEKDARVIVIHKGNGGVSIARNAGLDIARGKYITFVDSDDYLKPNTYRPNIDYLESHPEVDCLQFPIVCDERIVFTREYKKLTEECTFVGKDIIMNWWNGDIINHFVCNKIYRRDMWFDIRFPLRAYFEDAMVVTYHLKLCKRLFMSLRGGYFYRYNEDSILNSEWKGDKYIDFFKSKLMMWENVNELEYTNPIKIIVYLRALKLRAICSKKGYLNYEDYSEFLDSIPSIRLLLKSKGLGIKGWAIFIAIKMIGARRFVKLYGKV